MTTRKPPNLSFPDWIERQIRTAEAEGAFANLPGKGKPIPGIDRPQHELAWVVDKLRRENVDVAGVLPPALALAKEVELLPERLQQLRSEARVRAVLDDLNARIRRAQLAPQTGLPVRVRAVDVERAVEEWRAGAATHTSDATPITDDVPSPDEAPPTRGRPRLFRRSRR